MLRIRKTVWKFVYIAVGGGLTITVNHFLVSLLPEPAAAIVKTVVVLAFYFVAVRSFRGRDEPLEPPRAWWRMTAKPTAGFVLGVLALVSLGQSVVLAVVQPRTVTPMDILNAFQAVLLAGFYLYSSIRLARRPPEFAADDITPTGLADPRDRAPGGR